MSHKISGVCLFARLTATTVAPQDDSVVATRRAKRHSSLGSDCCGWCCYGSTACANQTFVLLAGKDRQLRPAPHTRRMGLAGVGVVDFPVGPAFDDLLQDNPRLHARQRRAQTE